MGDRAELPGYPAPGAHCPVFWRDHRRPAVLHPGAATGGGGPAGERDSRYIRAGRFSGGDGALCGPGAGVPGQPVPEAEGSWALHHLRPTFPGGGSDGGESCTFPGVRPGAAGGNFVWGRKQILGAGQGDCGLLLYAERGLRPRGSLSAGAPRPGDRPGQPASRALSLPRGLGTGRGRQPQGDQTLRQYGAAGDGHASAVCLGAGGLGHGALRLRSQRNAGGNAGIQNRNRLALQASAGYEGEG